MRRTLIALLLVAACSPTEVKRTGTDSGTTTTTATTTTAGVATTPQAPLEFSGSGEINTDPFTLAGGSYVVTYDYSGKCFYGVTLKRTSGTGLSEIVGTGSGPVSGSTNLYGIDGGTYYLDVITGPPPGCPWSVTFTPR